MNNPVFQQLDKVKIVTTTNVSWLSAPPGNATSPKGIWTVVGILGNELMISKDSTIIKIPIYDVIKVGGYGSETILNDLKRYWNSAHPNSIEKEDIK